MLHLFNYAHKGVSYADWYLAAQNAAKERFGSDSQTWLALFALTSPNATVKANITLATKALQQLEKGVPFDGYMTQIKNALNEWKETGKVACKGGLKVPSFYQNLIGNYEPVTVDRWIARADGHKGNVKGAKQYMEIADKISALAPDMNMSPAQCQASIWAGIQFYHSIVPQDTHSLILRSGKNG